MKGIELAKKYYDEYGAKMLHDEFPDKESSFAVGLFGSGSECFGFDDDTSADHDFEPGFVIIVPDTLDEKVIFNLKRAYAKLPMEYEGYKRSVMSPVGGNRHGVKTISEFLMEKTGTNDGNLTYIDYLHIPEENLAELTNGEVWRDDSKVFTNIRIKLSVLPKDVKYKKLAAELLVMAQAGQYNFNRCIEHKEISAARLSAVEFVNATIHVICLLNEVYMPYYKWKFKVLRSLSWPSDKNIVKNLESLLHINDDELDAAKTNIEKISKIIIDRLVSDKLVKMHKEYLEPYAYDINNDIEDNNLRNMHILSAL